MLPYLSLLLATYYIAGKKLVLYELSGEALTNLEPWNGKFLHK